MNTHHPNADPLEQLLGDVAALKTVSANQPIRLDHFDQSGVILQGRLELFLVAMEGEKPIGARYHVATLPAGTAFPKIEPSPDEQIGLLAVPGIDTRLLLTDADTLFGVGATPNGAKILAPAIDQWVLAISQGLARWITPRPEIHHSIPAGETCTPQLGERIRMRHGVGWIQAETDDAFLDVADLGEDDATAPSLCFPLSAEGWLTCINATERVPLPTEAVLQQQQAATGLAHFNPLIFQLGLMNLRLADVDEHNRLQARVAATEAGRDQAFARLRAAVDVRQQHAPPANHNQPMAAAFELLSELQYFNLRLPKRESGIETDFSVDELARQNQLRVREVNLRGDWWQQDFGQLLAFDRETNQPLILHFDQRGQAVIIDPLTRKQTALRQARGSLALTAYQLTTPLPDRKLGFGELLSFGLFKRGRDVLATLTNGMLLGILGLAIPIASGYMINQVIPDHEVGQLIELGVILTVLALTGFLLTYISSLGYARIEGHWSVRNQSAIMDRLLRLPLDFFQRYSAGELANRVGAISLIQTLISAASANAILSGTFSLFSFILMFFYDWRLAMWASLAFLLYALGSLWVLSRQLAQERPLAQLKGEIDGMLLQLVLGVAKIRLAAAEERAFARWADRFAVSRRYQLSAERLMAIQYTLNELFALSGLFLLVWAIGKPGEQETLLAIGAFAALLVAFQRFATGITQLTQVISQILAVEPQIERMRPLLEAEPEQEQSREDPGEISGGLEISHLRFRYTPRGPLILDDVSIRTEPGEMIAIVGPSGSGKSTLMRILLGFEQPESGMVLIDDKPLDRLDVTAVRRQMGVVLQNAQPLPGSLFENIVGAAGGSIEEAWAAADRVGLADDIRQMPMGMQTMILEGGGALSGGQMQRLMIARAIVGQPRILLLDEATSALDNRTQSVVSESLDRLNVTRIVVAHRLSTIINADRIYVLEQGRVTEVGTYQELLEADGTFAALARRQMTH